MATQKNKLGKGIIPSWKIYMVEEETLDRDPKGGGKEELREEEWGKEESRRPKYNKTTQLHYNSREGKRGGFFFFPGMNEMGGIYSSSGGNMNERPFNEGWQRIINLDLILAFGEILCIKWKDWWECGASKVRFSRNCYNNI